MSSKLVKNFKNFVFRERLFFGGEKLVVGVSGGADSVVLVKLLLEIKKKFDLELLLVHINYHLRGEESDGDEKFVREFAEKNGLRLEVVDYDDRVLERIEEQNATKFSEAAPHPRFARAEEQLAPLYNRGLQKLEVVDYMEYAKKKPPKVFVPQTLTPFTQGVEASTNLEERLRDFRYGVFENIRRGNNFSSGSTAGKPVVESLEETLPKRFDWVVVGHHQDDQVETFLMNLFRGAGVDGLSGMKTKDKDRKLLRPLLEFNKKEIKDFLLNIGQEWREDKSNSDNSFLRNRIRNELIPEIEKSYSKKFKEKVGGVMGQLQEANDIVEGAVNIAMTEVVTSGSGSEELNIDVEKYRKLSEGIKPLVFRELVRRLKGNLKNISKNNYWEFEKIMRSDKGKRQVMKIGKLKFEKVGSKLVLK